jgi:hypothetical protein
MKKIILFFALFTSIITQVNAQLCFNPVAKYAVSTQPQAITGNDFNGDGFIDLAVANTLAFNVSILLNNGTGSFGTPTSFTVEQYPSSICSADFNSDNFKDLVVTYGSDSISVLFGDGAGNFSAVTNYTTTVHTGALCTADFNADGFQDIATCNYTTNNLSVFLGNQAVLAVLPLIQPATAPLQLLPLMLMETVN